MINMNEWGCDAVGFGVEVVECGEKFSPAVIGAHKFAELAGFGGRADRVRIHVSISPVEDQPRFISNCPILITDLPTPSSQL
ncbi:hypothetical protein ABIE52_004694 [Rhodococcus sp. OAS809]